MSITHPHRYPLIALLAATLLLPACQNVPKYKKSGGKFDEWKEYEGKNFAPTSGTIAAIDTTAHTVTISDGKDSHVLPVTAATRIMHEGTDVPLAQLPLKTEVKYTVSQDGTRLLTIWYGHRLNQNHPAAAQHKEQNSFF